MPLGEEDIIDIHNNQAQKFNTVFFKLLEDTKVPLEGYNTKDIEKTSMKYFLAIRNSKKARFEFDEISENENDKE